MHILTRAPHIRVRMLVGTFVAGRRRRPGDVFDCLRTEAEFLLRDRHAELVANVIRIAPPAVPETPQPGPLAA